MKFGLPLSIGAHGAIIIASWLGFGFGKSQADAYQVIPVKILTLANETNVRAARVEPETAPEVIETAELPEAELSKAGPNQIPDKAPVKTADPKPDSKPQKPKPQKPKALSLDDLSALVAQSKDKLDEGTDANTGQTLLESERNQIQQAEEARLSAGRGDGMTTAYADAIMRRLYNSWRIPSGAPNLDSLVINVDVTLDRNGRVMTSKLSRESQRRAASDEYYRIAAESAIRAVQDAAEFKFLPRNEYERWSVLSLTFLPKDAPTGVPT